MARAFALVAICAIAAMLLPAAAAWPGEGAGLLAMSAVALPGDDGAGLDGAGVGIILGDGEEAVARARRCALLEAWAAILERAGFCCSIPGGATYGVVSPEHPSLSLLSWLAASTVQSEKVTRTPGGGQVSIELRSPPLSARDAAESVVERIDADVDLDGVEEQIRASSDGAVTVHRGGLLLYRSPSCAFFEFRGQPGGGRQVRSRRIADIAWDGAALLTVTTVTEASIDHLPALAAEGTHILNLPDALAARWAPPSVDFDDPRDFSVAALPAVETLARVSDTVALRSVELLANGKRLRQMEKEGRREAFMKDSTPLIFGENRVVARAVNNDGVEAARELFLYRQSAPAELRDAFDGGTRRALVVGVERYFDNRLGAAPGGARDAQAIQRLLVDPARGAMRREDVHLLTNEGATKAHFFDELAAFGGSLGEDDLAVVYLAGLGMLRDGERYFLFSESRSDDPARSALSISDLLQRIAALPARRAVVVLDCPFFDSAPGASGAYRAYGASGASGDSGASGASGDSGASGASGDSGASGASGSSGASGASGASGSSGAYGAYGVMAGEPGADENDRPGVTLITSRHPGGTDRGRGSFGRHILDGLRGGADGNGDGLVDALELYRFVARESTPEILRARDARRVPMWSGIRYGHYILARCPGK